MFASATWRQDALEDKTWNDDAFTETVAEGLSGRAKIPGSAKITLKSPGLYVTGRVKERTGGEQAPTTAYPVNVPDFPITMVK